MCFICRVAVTSISQMLHPLFLFTRSVYSVFPEMGFSCVEKQGFLYQFAGYKSKPVLAEKEELYFCWIWINALIWLSTIHCAHESRKRQLTEANPEPHFLKCRGGFSRFHFVSSHLHFACSWYTSMSPFQKISVKYSKLLSPNLFFVSSVSHCWESSTAWPWEEGQISLLGVSFFQGNIKQSPHQAMLRAQPADQGKLSSSSI